MTTDRVRATISDTVSGAFGLGYPHVLFTLSPLVYGCARPAARGVDAPARMMADAAKQVRQHQPMHARRPLTRPHIQSTDSIIPLKSQV